MGAFSAVLTAEDDEVPHCAPSTNASRGHLVVHVVDIAAGTAEWKLVGNNLPGDIIAAHIHFAPFGVAGPVCPAASANTWRRERRYRNRTSPIRP